MIKLSQSMWFWGMLYKHKCAYFSVQVPPHKWNVSAIVERLIPNLETHHTIKFSQHNTCSAFWKCYRYWEKQTNNVKNAFFFFWLWFLILKFRVSTWISTVLCTFPEVSESLSWEMEIFSMAGAQRHLPSECQKQRLRISAVSLTPLYRSGMFVSVCYFSLFQSQYLFWVVHI